MKLNTGKTAFVLGTFVAFVHFVWLLMVYLKVAQTYLNWIFGLHQISLAIKVLPFNLMSAIWLLVITFVVGYLMGWVFAFIWNRLVKGK